MSQARHAGGPERLRARGGAGSGGGERRWSVPRNMEVHNPPLPKRKAGFSTGVCAHPRSAVGGYVVLRFFLVFFFLFFDHQGTTSKSSPAAGQAMKCEVAEVLNFTL